MSYCKSELVLIDYEYLLESQIKERIEDHHLNEMLEKLSHYYNLGIIGNKNVNSYLQKKKKVHLFKYIFNNDGCECYQNNILTYKYKITNFISTSQLQQIISAVERFKKNFEKNNNLSQLVF